MILYRDTSLWATDWSFIEILRRLRPNRNNSGNNWCILHLILLFGYYYALNLMNYLISTFINNGEKVSFFCMKVGANLGIELPIQKDLSDILNVIAHTHYS